MSSVCQPLCHRATFSASSVGGNETWRKPVPSVLTSQMRKPEPGSWRKSKTTFLASNDRLILPMKPLPPGRSAAVTTARSDSRAEVVDVDAVVRQEPVGAGAVVDVRVVVIRRVGLAFDEDDLLEAQFPGTDRRLGASRARGRLRSLQDGRQPRQRRAAPGHDPSQRPWLRHPSEPDCGELWHAA